MKLLIGFVKLFLGGRARIKVECAESEGLVSALRSDWRWRRTRDAFVRTNPECAMCGGTQDLEVHHIVPWQADADLRYSQHNLVTLCRGDHFKYGHWRNWQDQNPHVLELAEVTTAIRSRR